MEPAFKLKPKRTWIDRSLTFLEWTLSVLCVLSGEIIFASGNRVSGIALVITGGILFPLNQSPQWLKYLVVAVVFFLI